jgi:hypothetical protein
MPTTRTVRVPGAHLSYEVRGEGPDRWCVAERHDERLRRVEEGHIHPVAARTVAARTAAAGEAFTPHSAFTAAIWSSARPRD